MSPASWGKIHNVLVSCTALQYYRFYVNSNYVFTRVLMKAEGVIE